MWTKLNSETPRGSPFSSEHRHEVSNAINAFLLIDQPGAHCVYFSGGTSNLTFTKTHGDQQSALRVFGAGARALDEAKAEAEFLRTCYSEECDVAVIETGEEELAIVDMTFLTPALPNPADVWALQERYQSHIATANLSTLFDRDRDIAVFVNGARLAIGQLTSGALLPDDVGDRANSLFDELSDYLDRTPRVPCHGDLSPRNILQNADGRFVAIDWEDRFWGVNDYDFLYWLTFMNNSSHLNRESLQISRHPRNISVAILTMIVIVKESVSLKAAVPREDRVSPAARLHTVLELL